LHARNDDDDDDAVDLAPQIPPIPALQDPANLPVVVNVPVLGGVNKEDEFDNRMTNYRDSENKSGALGGDNLKKQTFVENCAK